MMQIFLAKYRGLDIRIDTKRSAMCATEIYIRRWLAVYS